MNIKVLGTGCPKCEKLEAVTRGAVNNLSIDAEIEKVKDLTDIMSYGVMATPALVVDGKVVLAGKVPSIAEMEKILKG